MNRGRSICSPTTSATNADSSVVVPRTPIPDIPRSTFSRAPLVCLSQKHFECDAKKRRDLALEGSRVSRRIDDGGRSPEIGVQTQVSNYPVLLWFKRSWW